MLFLPWDWRLGRIWCCGFIKPTASSRAHTAKYLSWSPQNIHPASFPISCFLSDHKLCGIQTFKSLHSRSPDDAGDWEEVELEALKLESQPELLLPCCLLALLTSELKLEVDEVEELIEEDDDREVLETDIVKFFKTPSCCWGGEPKKTLRSSMLEGF